VSAPVQDRIEHGTNRGWYQHNYWRIPLCTACQAARDAALERQRAVRKEPFVTRREHREGAGGRPPARPIPAEYLPPEPPVLTGNAEIGTPIEGADLRIGDQIVFLGRRHRVRAFAPYHGSLRAVLGGNSARTAVCEDGFRLPHGPTSIVRIAPRGES